MKMEKISENQIRCVLTEDDLINRKIKLHELSYGSEKARNLFYDMMKQANVQFGFDSGGSPLMIEAIPTSHSLILNITKVKDPEELDTRFSSFSSSPAFSGNETHVSGADGILNLLKKLKEISDTGSEATKKPDKTKEPLRKTADKKQNKNLVESFRFLSLDDVIQASKSLGPDITCINSLYKYDSGAYLLIVYSKSQAPESFNRIYNILSEFSMPEHCFEAFENHLREHGYLMIADNAIQVLSKL